MLRNTRKVGEEVGKEKLGVKVLDPREVAKDMLDVLVKHKVPVIYLDQVLSVLREYAHVGTIIQNARFFEDGN